MSPAFWTAVLSAPSDEFEAIMDRLEQYEREREQQLRRQHRQEALDLIAQIERRPR